MTFEELKRIIPNANEREWYQHQNGGGWVQNTAQVASSAYVSENALVYENANVSGNARVLDNAMLYGNARVFGDAEVYGNSRVSGDAKVYKNARVLDNAMLYGNARVSENAKVLGNAKVFGDTVMYGSARVFGDAEVCHGEWNVSPLLINGTKHIITICAPKTIRIGCIEHHIDKWLASYEEIGKENQYSEEEIEEYYDYLQLIAKRRDCPSICGEINSD